MAMMSPIVLVLVAFLSQTLGDSDLSSLANNLINGYTSFVNPDSTTLGLSIGYGLVTFDYDETDNILTTHLWERMGWRDSRLAWDKADHGGVAEIRLPSDLVWTPDVLLYNTYDNAVARQDVNVIVYNTGVVLWIPPSIYKSRCDSGPSNTFNCTLRFGSWTYNTNELPLELWKGESQLDTVMFEPSYSPYDLVSTSLDIVTTSYEAWDESYSEARASIIIRRRAQ